MTRCGPAVRRRLREPVSPNAEETELRLAISAVAAAKLWKSAALAPFDAEIPRVHQLVSVYWDTPDFRLRDRGLALRVRRTDAGPWTQTLKTASREVDTRCEYEGTLPGAQPDLQVARRHGWPGDARVLAVERKLRPIFNTRIVRTARRVRFDDGTVAEVALDRGAITLEQRRPAVRERLLEIEIELVSGRASRLYELANRLVAELPSVRLLFTSKSARGYRLLTGSPMAARSARDIEVPQESSAAMIGYRAFAESVAHVQDNVDCVRLTADPEGVHQMRVAIRRLRVAAGIASEAGLPALSDKLVDELRWLWALLGDCRDADVFATETWPQIDGEAADGATPTTGFEANVATRRDATRRELRRALGTRRFQFIMLLLAWIAALQREALTTFTRKPGPRHLSRRMLSRRAKRIVDLAIDELTDEQRHRVRIDAKKLRYLAEFVAGLYAHRDTRRYLRRLAAVQAALGGLNDLTAIEHWVKTGTSKLPTRERRHVARLCKDYAAHRAPVLAGQLTDAWRKLGRTEPFWR